MNLIKVQEVACPPQTPAPQPLSATGLDRLRILLLDDEEDYLEAISGELDDFGFTVECFTSGKTLLERIGKSGNSADIIVLDWSLPEMPGIEVLSGLRRLGMNMPAVFLTGYRCPDLEGIALDKGALDFIDKTRGVDILAKRLRLIAKARNSPAAAPPRAEDIALFGQLALKLGTNRALWRRVDVDLTVGEYKIVRLLAERQGAPATYREIYDCLHYVGFFAGCGDDGFRTNVRSAIKRIRRKFQAIEGTFDAIQNDAGTGYRWMSSPSSC